MPNCEHSLAENIPGVLETIGAFVLGAWLNKDSLPRFDWSFSSNGE